MPNNPPYQVTIYTIGHSNIELEDFLSLLDGIEVVVDVRSVPFSKYASQFNLKNIKSTLESIGIEYVFMEDEYVGNVLGGRPRDEDCYEDGKVVYENIMRKSWYKEGISALIELAENKKVAIMCSEEDPYRCHRHHLISQSLLGDGVSVFHIRGDGRTEKFVTLLDYA
ncbi:MAG: hypothetical protein SYNGOMJ08_00742 [Candidatus Syntrophoarchaeum sp. GoM_oil]|nr:MAG: hypothetical protein SYNGOMJ08_00742 [Candidatus Syntrophoarchaeum sp. GoM_oil]